MLIQINTNTVATAKDLILIQNFNLQMGKKVIIIGADMTLSVHVDNKNKDILILAEGPAQRLDDTTLTAEVNNSFLFVNATKNILIQTKILLKKILYTVFRSNFKRFYN